MPTFLRLWVVGCTLSASALAPTGCAFDASDLDERTACRRNEDCFSRVCSFGQCTGLGPSRDASPSPLCDDASRNPCGGCSPLVGQEGAACLDACGTLQCAEDGESLTCDISPPNACGGCEPLPAAPQSPCSPCGRWTCHDGSLVCRAENGNACGGCGPLDAEPNAPCNLCGGLWTCDTTESLVCAGRSTNLCGGCTQASGFVPAASCACPGATAIDPHLWRCEDGEPACTDGNDTQSRATDLGTRDAGGPAVTLGSALLSVPRDVDWYELRIQSPNGDVPASTRGRPVARIEAAAPAELCAVWIYDDGRPWDPDCIEGARSREIGGVSFCCATGTNMRTARIASASSPTGSVFRTDSDGRLLLRVTASGTDTCVRYTLTVEP
jgi:hypothetical protein